MGRIRYRMRFTKREALRYISHHDLMRVFELALRRSSLPVSYTQGFNPRPRVSFALALPLGVESLDEIVDIDFEQTGTAPDKQQVLQALAEQMPPGLTLLDAEVAEGRPRVVAVEYVCIVPPEILRPEQLQVRLEEFLASESVPYSRSRGDRKAPRKFDARAFALDARLDGKELSMRLKAGQDGGMKPSDLLALLGLDADRILVTKTRTILAEPTSPGAANDTGTGPQKTTK
jgi:radical SAM-linked protein